MRQTSRATGERKMRQRRKHTESRYWDVDIEEGDEVKLDVESIWEMNGKLLGIIQQWNGLQNQFPCKEALTNGVTGECLI